MAEDPPRKRTPARAVPIVSPIEKSSPASHRDHYTPPGHIPVARLPTQPQTWDEDRTPPTTDPALYRKLRSIEEDLKDHAAELGTVTTQVAVIHARTDELGKVIDRLDAKQDEQTSKLATISGQLGIIIDDRHRHLAVTQTRMIAESTTTETLAKEVLKERRDDLNYKRNRNLKIFGGLFSAAFLGALVTAIASRC